MALHGEAHCLPSVPHARGSSSWWPGYTDVEPALDSGAGDDCRPTAAWPNKRHGGTGLLPTSIGSVVGLVCILPRRTPTPMMNAAWSMEPDPISPSTPLRIGYGGCGGSIASGGTPSL